MRKVYLRLKEMNEYKHVKNYVDHSGRIAALALKPGCSERTAWRKVAGYKAHGKAFFVHSNRDHSPITSICEQAQGKIERLFQTLQSRLVVELRIRNICTIKGANKFLKEYLPEYNQQFATPIHSTMNGFEFPPSKEQINLTLAVLSTRVVDTGCAIRYQNKFYRFLDEHAKLVPLRHKTKITVIQALDGKLYASCKNTVFALEEIREHKPYSKRVDHPSCKEEKPKTIYIPNMTHPWRTQTLQAYQKKQWDMKYSCDEICYTTEFLR